MIGLYANFASMNTRNKKFRTCAIKVALISITYDPPFY
jgi:hypothetical protein